MPRRTYDKRSGRLRSHGQNTDWSWLLELLARERLWRSTPPQTPGEQRRRTEKDTPR
jgi:hypothetical protein